MRSEVKWFWGIVAGTFALFAVAYVFQSPPPPPGPYCSGAQDALDCARRLATRAGYTIGGAEGCNLPAPRLERLADRVRAEIRETLERAEEIADADETFEAERARSRLSHTGVARVYCQDLQNTLGIIERNLGMEE